jgi:predicted TIM-barrel fold metal-dependent hydrolase
MKVPYAGAIDCDLHPAMPSVAALLPYLNEYWRDQLVNRHIDKYSFILTSYPPQSPLSARPDWRQASGLPAGDLDAIRRHALDPFGSRYAICNVLHGALALFNEDMAAALCAAVNDWTAKELLDRETRLRASILVPAHNPALAVNEIERVAGDRRFVQVLLLAMGEMLLGRRLYWPIYAAAQQPRPSDTDLRWASMPAAPITTRRCRRAGRRTRSRTTSPSRPRSNRSC